MTFLRRRENAELDTVSKLDMSDDKHSSTETLAHDESMSSLGASITLAPHMDGSSSGFLPSGSALVLDMEADKDIIQISRDRIDFGKFLGCGSFAQVYRVAGILKERKSLSDSFRLRSRSLRQLNFGDADAEERKDNHSPPKSRWDNRRCKSGNARLDDMSSMSSMNDSKLETTPSRPNRRMPRRGTAGGASTPDDLSGSSRGMGRRGMGIKSRFQSMRSLNSQAAENEENEKLLAHGPYAIKVLDHKKLKLPRLLRAAAEDLRTEVGIMKLCRDCPHVLQVRALPDIDDAEWTRVARVDSLFIMTDELSETLDHRIEQWREHKGASYNSPSLLSQKTRYALQLCGALKFLHEHRIVYRDLKPENVGFMANKDDERDQKAGYEGADRIQLFDFGLCRELPAMTTIGDKNSDSWKMFYSKTHEESDNIDDGNTGVYCLSEASGSAKYLAGEVVMSGGYCNLKCDVYSWAMVFFEMLSDERAFPGFSVDQLEEVIWKRGSRPSLSKSECLTCLPSSITGLLKKSWSKFVYKRPTSEACCKELESILVELQK